MSVLSNTPAGTHLSSLVQEVPPGSDAALVCVVSEAGGGASRQVLALTCGVVGVQPGAACDAHRSVHTRAAWLRARAPSSGCPVLQGPHLHFLMCLQ